MKTYDERKNILNCADYDGVISDWKDATNWFDGEYKFTLESMHDMFSEKRFGEGEIQVILAALMKNGVDFI